MFISLILDDQGRYSYTNQPSICKWNCMKLAEAIKDALPLPKSRAVLDEVYVVTGLFILLQCSLSYTFIPLKRSEGPVNVD